MTTTKVITRYETGTGGAHFEYGADLSSSPITAGFLENTPWRIPDGSSFAGKVSLDTIGGKAVKVIETTAVGDISLHTSELRQTPTEAAYGYWSGYLTKADLSIMRFMICATVEGTFEATGQDGYLLLSSGTEDVRLYRVDNAVATLIFQSAAGVITAGTPFFLEVDRLGAGEFTIKVDGSILPASVGSNPVTDNTHTESLYMNFDSATAAGNCLVLSDKAGNHSFKKDKL